MNFVKPSSVSLANEEAISPPHSRQWPISYRSVGHLALVVDVVTILGCGVACGVVYNLGFVGFPDVIAQYLASAAVVAAFYVSVLKGQSAYDPTELLQFKAQVSTVITAWLGVFLFLAGAVFTLKIGDEFSRGAILSFAATGLGLLLVERAFYRSLLTRGLEGQRFSGRTAVLISDDRSKASEAIVPALLRYGFQLKHHLTLPLDQHDADHQNKLITNIVDYLRNAEVEEAIVCIDFKYLDEATELFSGLRKLPMPVTLIPHGAAANILYRPSHVMGEAVCINLQREPLDKLELAAKRIIDLMGALAGLILLLPLMIMTAVVIKLESPGPVLFRQRRRGFNGNEFSIYKFRTMSVLEDGEKIRQATKEDGRLTRVGRWLRRTSIDELPQLLNVIGGSMSLVGPRPHAVAHDNHFNKTLSIYAFRHHVKPGLTGWAQIHGYRGATPTITEIQRRVEYDLWYIDNWSLLLDFLIILRTFFEVLRRRNAY